MNFTMSGTDVEPDLDDRGISHRTLVMCSWRVPPDDMCTAVMKTVAVLLGAVLVM